MLKSTAPISRLLAFAEVACPQTAADVFGSTILYSIPDTTVWSLVLQTQPTEGRKAVLTFQHLPIRDSMRQLIRPDLALMYEHVTDSMDVVEYSAGGFSVMPSSFKYT